MFQISRIIRAAVTALGTAAGLAGLAGCETAAGTAALIGGGAAYNSRSPGHEIEQVYYLGVFDPQDQVPPTIYRVRVRGQSSVMGQTQFASGWVPAQVIDSLGSHVSANFSQSGVQGSGSPLTPVGGTPVKVSKGEYDLGNLETGRRLMQFGPEGFRETPRDHRLVIVMGHNPENFFTAIDQALGAVSQVRAEGQDNALVKKLFEALLVLRAESDQLQDVGRDLGALQRSAAHAQN
jgi:hypothetical protein